MVIIDTSVWIPALTTRDSRERFDVEKLIEANEAALLGIVLLEVLRGARSLDHFERLRSDLAGATILLEDEATWLLASRLMLDLKLRGQTIPMADALIAAQSIQGSHSLYTHDRHFERVPGLRLYEAP